MCSHAPYILGKNFAFIGAGARAQRHQVFVDQGFKVRPRRQKKRGRSAGARAHQKPSAMALKNTLTLPYSPVTVRS
jgi:hypothetical protein